MSGSARLTRRFYRRDARVLARELLGRVMVRVLEDGMRLAGRIVEVEAYLGSEDRAAHSFGGRRTARNASMYLDGGHAYVYFTYGMHYCVNVVAGRVDNPVACLIRALEPLEGIELMRRRRKVTIRRPRDLCGGPAKLTQALRIDRALNGVDLTHDGRLWLERGRRVADAAVRTAPRIGVGYAGEWAAKPLRYFVVGNANVSMVPG